MEMVDECDPSDHMQACTTIDRLNGRPCMSWSCQVLISYSESESSLAEQWLVG